jgi:ASC-1-like (ASCH) protein
MTHGMKLAVRPFEDIRDGRKVIESRLYDEKRQKIQLGDEIVFSNDADSSQAVRMKVIDLLRHPTFEELFADLDPSFFGGTSRESLLSQIKAFYSDEEEAKYGVVGIRLQKID